MTQQRKKISNRKWWNGKKKERNKKNRGEIARERVVGKINESMYEKEEKNLKGEVIFSTHSLIPPSPLTFPSLSHLFILSLSFSPTFSLSLSPHSPHSLSLPNQAERDILSMHASPFIVRLLDSFQSSSRLFFAMELAAGER